MTACSCDSVVSSTGTPTFTVTNNSTGAAVDGVANSATNPGGTNACGVVGWNTYSVAPGVYGYGQPGVHGACAISGGIAVRGLGGTSTGTTGGDFECLGSNSTGVYAKGGGYSLYVQGTGYFTGYVSKPGGGWRVDDPRRPETHWLNHEFCESPKAQNVYRGTATLDSFGLAEAVLPDYYEAICENGAAIANGAKAEKIVGGRFRLRGSPCEEVEWVVFADRADPWQKANGKPDSFEKDEQERGFFLHPELFEKGEESHVNPRSRASAALTAEHAAAAALEADRRRRTVAKECECGREKLASLKAELAALEGVAR